MTDRPDTAVLRDLARARDAFQLRSIATVVREGETCRHGLAPPETCPYCREEE